MAQDGRGYHGDPAGHARIGRLGGRATASKHSSEFYAEIGRLGGQHSSGSFKRGSERARLAGQKGGRANRAGK